MRQLDEMEICEVSGGSIIVTMLAANFAAAFMVWLAEEPSS